MNKSMKQSKGNARRVPKKTHKPSKEATIKYGSTRRSLAPLNQGATSVMSRPVTRNLPNGDIVIKHREYCQDINGSINFMVQKSISVNPGSINLFPWLAGIASNYESYLFNSLVFRYENTCNTVATGTVILTVDYDPDDPAPTSKQQALAYRGAVRCPSWNHCEHRSLKEDLNKRKSYYVRRGVLPNGAERDTYDIGSLTIITQGMGDTGPVGELYVEYEVRLMTPQLNDLSVGNSLYARLNGNNTGAASSFMVSNAFLTNLGIVVDNFAPSQWRFYFNFPWQGYISFFVTGTGLNLAGPIQNILVGDDDNSQVEVLKSLTDVTGVVGTDILAVEINALDYLQFDIPNTTITGTFAYFGQARCF